MIGTFRPKIAIKQINKNGSTPQVAKVGGFKIDGNLKRGRCRSRRGSMDAVEKLVPVGLGLRQSIQQADRFLSEALLQK